MLPDEIAEEWTTHDLREFLTYHKLLAIEQKRKRNKR